MRPVIRHPHFVTKILAVRSENLINRSGNLPLNGSGRVLNQHMHPTLNSPVFSHVSRIVTVTQRYRLTINQKQTLPDDNERSLVNVQTHSDFLTGVANA